MKPRIGVLVNELDGVYQSEVLRGLRRAANGLDVHLLCFPGGDLANSDGVWGELNLVFHLATLLELDGIVSVSGTFVWSESPQESARYFARFGTTPIVSIGDTGTGIPVVKPDNRAGMAALVDHFLHHHGFRRIAFLAGPENNGDAQERMAVFRERCALAGVAVEEDLILPGHFSLIQGKRAVERLVAEGRLPEAIIAANDEMGLAVIAALVENGVRVPEDVAVCGFDDLAAILYDGPPLSSVRQDVAGQIELAVRLLVAQLREGSPIAAETKVPTHAIVRHSCGCSGLSAGLSQRLLWEDPARAEADLRALGEALAEELAGKPGRLRDELSAAAGRMTAAGLPLDDLKIALQVLQRECFATLAPDTPRAASLLLAAQTWLDGAARIHRVDDVIERVFPSWLLSSILQTRLPSSEFSLRGTLNFLRDGLLALGVRNAYLALFPRIGRIRRWDDCDLPEEAQLVLAIRDGETMPTADFERFPTVDLTPFPLFHQDGSAIYGLLPIFQQSEHYGYLILDLGVRYNVRIEQLREAISNLITGTFVVGELDRARELLRIDLDRANASRQQLAELAERDELTGLLNRRGFLSQAGTMKLDENAVLLLISADMDGLKTINDTWGHAAGDEALCAFADVLRASFRADDLIARFGGDEFMVLTQSFGADTEARVRSRLTQRIEQYNGGHGAQWQLAASLGLVMLEAGDRRLDLRMQEADRRLYAEKRLRKAAQRGD